MINYYGKLKYVGTAQPEKEKKKKRKIGCLAIFFLLVVVVKMTHLPCCHSYKPSSEMLKNEVATLVGFLLFSYVVNWIQK